MKTLSISTENAQRDWVVVDATGIPVGRLASRVAAVLRGKTKPSFTPHADTGDFVIVVNAEKTVLTGKKWDDKVYYSHSGYFGGLKEARASELHAKDPTAIVRRAIEGMIPRGPLGRRIAGKLKLYAGPDHPHQAQQPRTLDIATT